MEFNIRQEGVIGTQVTQETELKIKQALVQTIGQIIAHKVDEWLMQKTEQELKEEIQNFINEGILQRPPNNIKCPECGTVLSPDEPFCPRCNWRHDLEEEEEEERIGVETLEGEEISDEDIPRSESSGELEDDIPVEEGIHERLSSFLKEKGFLPDEADLGASLVNYALRLDSNGFYFNDIKGQIPEEEKVLQIWNEVVTIPELKNFIEMNRVLKEVEVMARNEEPKIIIQKAGGEFKVIVKNPFEALKISDLSYKVPLSQIGGSKKNRGSIGIRFYYSRLINLPETLRKIGEALVKLRQDFFEAKDQQDAERILKEKPLTERELAEEAHIHYSTLNKQKNKWARFIETPWGIKQLQDFLEPASKGSKEKRISAVEEIIGEMIQNYPKTIKGKVTAKSIKEDLEKMEIFLSIRTINYYRKKIKTFSQQKQGQDVNSAQYGY